MEEPFLVSDEHDGSIGSTCELSENCLRQDVPLHEALELENHRLQLEIEGLRLLLAQQTAHLVGEADKDPTDSLKDSGNYESTMTNDARFEAEIDRLLANCTKAGNDIADALLQVEHAECQRNELQNGLQKIQSRCAELENDNQRLLEERSFQEAEYENVVERLHSEIADWMRKHDRLKHIIAGLECEVVDYVTRSAELELENARLRSDNPESNTEQGKLREVTERLESELRQAQSRIRDLEPCATFLSQPENMSTTTPPSSPSVVGDQTALHTDVTRHLSDHGAAHSQTSLFFTPHSTASHAFQSYMTTSGDALSANEACGFGSTTPIGMTPLGTPCPEIISFPKAGLDTPFELSAGNVEDNVEDSSDIDSSTNYGTPPTRRKSREVRKTSTVQKPRSRTSRTKKRKHHHKRSSIAHKQGHIESDTAEDSETSIQTIVNRRAIPIPPNDHIEGGAGRNEKQLQSSRRAEIAQQQRQRRSEEISDETDEVLKKRIQDSYGMYKLKTRLQFRYGPGTFNRSTIDLGTNWKRRSILTEEGYGRLEKLLGKVLECLPNPTNSKQMQKERDLVRRLCRVSCTVPDGRSLKAIAVQLRQERDHTRDESKLADFEFYSTMIVMKHVDEEEFHTAIGEFSDYQSNLMDIYHSLHCVLASLDSSWRGLHTLLVIYLLRSGKSRLLDYFSSTTRPAAIELLEHRLNDHERFQSIQEFIRSFLREVVELSKEINSPLERLQERIRGIMEPAIVMEALGYPSHYSPQFSKSAARASLLTPEKTPQNPRFAKSLNAHEQITVLPSADRFSISLPAGTKRKALSGEDELARSSKKRRLDSAGV